MTPINKLYSRRREGTKRAKVTECVNLDKVVNCEDERARGAARAAFVAFGLFNAYGRVAYKERVGFELLASYSAKIFAALSLVAPLAAGGTALKRN